MAAKKPTLTENQRLQRLHFAQRYINWGINEWSSVLFTDESCIETVSSSSVRVYRPSGFRYEPHYIKNIKRSGRTTVSVWGCMSAQGIGSLCRIRGHLDGVSYCDILEHTMIPDVLNNHFPDGFFLLQQVYIIICKWYD